MSRPDMLVDKLTSQAAIGEFLRLTPRSKAAAREDDEASKSISPAVAESYSDKGDKTRKSSDQPTKVEQRPDNRAAEGRRSNADPAESVWDGFGQSWFSKS